MKSAAFLALIIVLSFTAPLSAAVYDVTSYGALGNGVADDGPSFNSALTAANTAGGGVVLVPCTAASYRIATSITLRSNVILRGEGYCSYLNIASLATGMSGSSVSNVTIENLRIGGTSSNAIAFTGSSAVKVRNSWISGATATGASYCPAAFYCETCNDTIVENNLFSGNGYGSSLSVSSIDILFNAGGSRNRVVHNTCTSTAVTMHIGLQTTAANQTCDDNEITGNTVSGAITKSDNSTWGYGIYQYVSGTAPNRTTIRGNHISGTGGDAIYNHGGTHTNIVANVIYDVDKTLAGAGTHATGAISSTNVSTDTVIADNIINTDTYAGVHSCGSRTTITGNTIENIDAYGIYVDNGASQTTVSGNVLRGCKSAGVMTNSGYSSYSHLLVSANTIDTIGDNGNGTWSNGAYGIGVVNVSNLTLTGNTVKSVGAYGVVVQSCSRYSVTGNTVTDVSKYGSNVYDGIAISQSNNGVVASNASSDGSARYGISVMSSSTVEVNGNQVLNNVSGGVITTGSTNVTVDGNRWTSGAMEGSVTLSAGTATVSTTEIRAGDGVLLTPVPGGGTAPGVLRVSGITGGTSFTITSSSATDTTTVFWRIVH